MAVAQPAGTRQAKHPGKISLRRRLQAWWEGYELDDKGAANRAEARRNKRAEPTTAKPFGAWNDAHLEILQGVWGKGLIRPGDIDYICHLVKPLGLNPAMSILELGGGIGGAARIMAETFGVWVTSLEREKAMVEVGTALSTEAGLDKKAAIQVFDPEVCEPKARAYDCVISLGFLYSVMNKARLLEVLDNSLKAGGQILLTDFVVPNPGLDSETLQEWAQGEPYEVAPWSVRQYSQILGQRGLEVRITEDITSTVRQQVIAAFADYMASVGSDAGDLRTQTALVHEVELWTRRVKAMESGELKVYRLFARKASSSNLLSDW